MRKVLALLASAIFALSAVAVPSLKAGQKYHIVVAAHTGGCLADGKSAGQQAPLYYLQTATTDSYTYWVISEVSSGKYSISNAATGQYITYDGERIEASKRYVGMTDAMDGDNSLWQFEDAGTNSWGIVSVGHPAGRLDVREGSNLVGTYDRDGFSNIETFMLYDESGTQVLNVTADTGGSGFDVDSWQTASVTSIDGWDTNGFWILERSNYYNGEANVTYPFAEKWVNSNSGTLGSDHLLQHLENLPAGQYTLTADIIASYQGNASVTVTGATLVCGNASTSVGTADGTPQRFTVTTDFAGGTLDIGVNLSNTNANWVAMDNLHLRYNGTAEALISGEKAKVIAELSDYYESSESVHKVDSVAALYTATSDIFSALETLRKSVASLPKADPIVRGLANLTIGGHTLAYDERMETYLVSIPEADFGSSLTATVSYDKKTGWGDLAIDGTVVSNQASHTFTSISGGKTYTLSTTDATGKTVSRNLTFTFLPIVQIYGTFSNDYSKGYIRVSEPEVDSEGLLNMKAKWRGGITNGTGKHKRNYHVKLQAAGGGKEDHEFFGLRDDNSWILESCQVDMSRCRNRVLTDLWNDYSTPPYYKASEKKARTGTRGHFVEVLLNNQYVGIYCMTEAMDRKQMKLKKQDDDGTVHGQLWKSKDWSYGVFMGHDYNRNYYPRTSPAAYDNSSEMWQNYEVKYPDYEDNGNTTDWSVLYDAVNFVCTSSDDDFKQNFGSYFDYPLLVDYYILMETTLSADNHGKNMFFAVYDKQVDKKITFGVWDMDATMGQRWSDDYYHRTDIMNPEADYATYITQNEHGDYNLFKRLRETNYNGFNEEVRVRYNELRKNYLNTDSLLARFSRYLTSFKRSGAEAREAARWNGDSDISGHNIDFSDEMEYLNDWVTRRMDYLDDTRFDIASLSTGISATKADSYRVGVYGSRIVITSGSPVTVNIHSVNGSLVRTVSVNGTATVTGLPAGVYIVGKQKVVVR